MAITTDIIGATLAGISMVMYGMTLGTTPISITTILHGIILIIIQAITLDIIRV